MPWISSCCCCLVTKSCLTLCNPLGYSQVPLSSTISQSLLKFTPIESVMPSNHLILCPRLFLLPAFFPRMRLFFNELTLCIRWSKYWSFSFIISPSNEYSGLISSKIDWFDLFAVQGTLKSLLQHQFESINSSALCLLNGPALTCIHDCWKDHSLDCMNLGQQGGIFAF